MEPKTKALVDALLVMTLTPHIKAYLEQNDPKALQQARDALYPPEPVFLDMCITDGTEKRLGVVQEDSEGKYIEDFEFGLAMAIPAGVTLSVGTAVMYTIPNPNPNALVEDFCNKVSGVEVVDIPKVK